MQIQKSADMLASLRLNRLGLLDHEVRNAVDHGVGQTFTVANQMLLDSIMTQRAMTVRTGQYLKEFRIHFTVLSGWSAGR